MRTAVAVGGTCDACDRLSLILRIRWSDLQLSHISDGREALEAIARDNPSIVFLCPDGSFVLWSDWIVEARARSPVTPLLIVGEESSCADRILAFELGADDWLQPNCVPMELIARVNIWLRRAGYDSREPGNRDGLRIYRSHRVDVNGRSVKLSPREYRILCHLAERERTPVSTDELLSTAWGDTYEGDSQLLRQTIRRLRQKLSDEPPQLILNQRGAGYMLDAACRVDDRLAACR